MAQQMTADYKNLPASVLAKIAELEHQCISLSTKLDRSRRDLQGLRVQQRDLTPRTVHDEYEANRENPMAQRFLPHPLLRQSPREAAGKRRAVPVGAWPYAASMIASTRSPSMRRSSTSADASAVTAHQFADNNASARSANGCAS